jgi:hypothetical protein
LRKAFEKKAAVLYNRLYEIEQAKSSTMGADVLQPLQVCENSNVSLRQSIIDNSLNHPTTPNRWPDGDLASCLAEDITELARSHKTNPSTV